MSPIIIGEKRKYFLYVIIGVLVVCIIIFIIMISLIQDKYNTIKKFPEEGRSELEYSKFMNSIVDYYIPNSIISENKYILDKLSKKAFSLCLLRV